MKESQKQTPTKIINITGPYQWHLKSHVQNNVYYFKDTGLLIYWLLISGKNYFKK